MSLAITLLPLCPAHIPVCFRLLSHAKQCLHPHFWLSSKCSRGRDCLVCSVSDKALLGSPQSGAAHKSGDGDKMYCEVEAGQSKYVDRGT